MSKQGNDVLDDIIVMLSTCQSKKATPSFQNAWFVFGNISVPIYRKIGNFFFNWKVLHKFDGISLHTYGFLIVDFLNFNPYAIAFGRSAASLPTTKLQSQVIFFEESFFVS